MFRSVEESELANLEKIHMVETEEQLEYALSRPHLLGWQFICIGNQYHRICAPEQSNDTMYSCILWTKETPEDTNPTWDKVVSDSNLTQDFLIQITWALDWGHHLQYALSQSVPFTWKQKFGIWVPGHCGCCNISVFIHGRYPTDYIYSSLDVLPQGEHIQQGGIMLKGLGIHSIYGIPREGHVYDPPLTLCE